jgi:hypothetical protein
MGCSRGRLTRPFGLSASGPAAAAAEGRVAGEGRTYRQPLSPETPASVTAMPSSPVPQRQSPTERRLRAVGAALQPPAPVPEDSGSLLEKYDDNLRPEPYGHIPPECSAQAPAQRLSDIEVQRFIVDGFLTVDTPFAEAPVHESIVAKLDSAIERMGNPGNNLLAVVPDIQKVFDHPAVRGAVESLLGPDAFLHPHCHCHNHQPGAGDQSWHKDEYNYDCTMRSPRCEWIFALYYPQTVTPDMGPTAILPQYQSVDSVSNENASLATEEEAALTVPAGTVALIDFDCWHRGSANTSDQVRYMCKFHYCRMGPPTGPPSWDHKDSAWQIDPETVDPERMRNQVRKRGGLPRFRYI